MGFGVWGSGFGVQGVGCGVQGAACRVQGAGCRVKGAGFAGRVSGAGSAGECVKFCLHPTPCTLHPAPHTLHPAPCTLHPQPHTLHPTLYTPTLDSGEGVILPSALSAIAFRTTVLRIAWTRLGVSHTQTRQIWSLHMVLDTPATHYTLHSVTHDTLHMVLDTPATVLDTPYIAFRTTILRSAFAFGDKGAGRFL